jgi:NADPH:quinone reductase-like Zn-dependent oxidoreductase
MWAGSRPGPRAHEGVNCGQPDWGSALMKLTGGAGVDVVLDNVGGDVFHTSLWAAARSARVPVVGFARDCILRIAASGHSRAN